MTTTKAVELGLMEQMRSMLENIQGEVHAIKNDITEMKPKVERTVEVVEAFQTVKHGAVLLKLVGKVAGWFLSIGGAFALFWAVFKGMITGAMK